jgi:hypothetical protein
MAERNPSVPIIAHSMRIRPGGKSDYIYGNLISGYDQAQHK